MKKIFRLKAIILTFLLVFINCSGVFAEIEKESDIQFEEFPVLNYDYNQYADRPVPFIYGDGVYVLWAESVGENQDEIKIKGYDKNKWIDIDTSSLNDGINSQVYYVYPRVKDDGLYVQWTEWHGENKKDRVKKYFYGKWIEVDPDSLTNYDVFIDVNNQSYDVCLEYNENEISQLRVSKLNNNKWIEIDNGSLNYDVNKYAQFVQPISCNNELYIMWHEWDGNVSREIKIKKYDGEKWINVDSSFLNYDSYMDSIVYNNELYIMWSKENENEIRQLKIRKYNGTKWEDVGGGVLNYDTTKTAYFPRSRVWNNELYVIWQEADKKENYQIRMKKLKENKWIQIDNGSLNYDSNISVPILELVIYNNEVYITWDEDGKARLKKLVNKTKAEDKTKN